MISDQGKQIVQGNNEVITFPRHEWDHYQTGLKTKTDVHTLRVFKEYKKYEVDQVYNTEWGWGQFKVIKSEEFKTLNEVIEKYPHYLYTTTKKQKEDIDVYSQGKIERLTLRPV